MVVLVRRVLWRLFQVSSPCGVVGTPFLVDRSPLGFSRWGVTRTVWRVATTSCNACVTTTDSTHKKSLQSAKYALLKCIFSLEPGCRLHCKNWPFQKSFERINIIQLLAFKIKVNLGGTSLPSCSFGTFHPGYQKGMPKFNRNKIRVRGHTW